PRSNDRANYSESNRNCYKCTDRHRRLWESRRLVIVPASEQAKNRNIGVFVEELRRPVRHDEVAAVRMLAAKAQVAPLGNGSCNRLRIRRFLDGIANLSLVLHPKPVAEFRQVKGDLIGRIVLATPEQTAGIP